MSAKINGIEVRALRQSALSSIAEEKASRPDSSKWAFMLLIMTLLAFQAIIMFKVFELEERIDYTTHKAISVEKRVELIDGRFGLGDWE